MKSNRLNILLKGAVKRFSLFTLLFSFAIASCNREELAPQTESTTFTLSIDQAETRATSTIAPARYVMEVWSEDGTQPENVFENGTTNHTELLASSGNVFTVTLDKTKAYTCLFWADDNDAFNAASLKAVSLNSGKDMTEAYHAKVDVAKGKNPVVAVTLKRAMAKITLVETAAVKTTDDLALKFSNTYTQFDVLAGSATGTAVDWTQTIKPAATTGTIGTLYIFAKPTQELTELKFTYASETDKTVSNIPFQMNYATTIKGEYSNFYASVFTISNEVEDYTNNPNVTFPKVYKIGDYYPDPNVTFNDDKTVKTGTAPIGVVFWVDATDASYNSTAETSAKGKIVGLTEGATLAWSTKTVATGATDVNNGRTNMQSIAAFIANPTNGTSWEDYPVLKWVAQLNGKANGGWDANDKWYLPATEELKALYGKYDSNDNCIDWGAVRNEVTVSLSAIGATQFKNNSWYWSSTEKTNDKVLIFSFSDGYFKATENKGETTDLCIRAISAF